MDMAPIILNTPTASCSIYAEAGALSEAGHIATSIVTGRRAVIVTDTNVARRYLAPVRAVFEDAGFTVNAEILPAGERSKSPETVIRLYSFFATSGITRSDLIVCLGGGVPGDATGFAAATFMRGITFIQIPTTLLAQIDSAVGGKNAVNLPEGKNLVGTFYQPTAVIADSNFLSTLPKKQLADGMSELIKYGAICDAALFARAADSSGFPDQEMIRRCIEIKCAIVEKDEHDTGVREMLNFGHTVGHAVEAAGAYSVFSHGQAVSCGMVLAAKIGILTHTTEYDVAHRLVTALTAHGLPVTQPYPVDMLMKYIVQDKKNRDSVCRMILLEKIGSVTRRSFSADELSDLLRAALEMDD